eukprot:287626-Amphidinium_carterae.1
MSGRCESLRIVNMVRKAKTCSRSETVLGTIWSLLKPGAGRRCKCSPIQGLLQTWHTARNKNLLAFATCACGLREFRNKTHTFSLTVSNAFTIYTIRDQTRVMLACRCREQDEVPPKWVHEPGGKQPALALTWGGHPTLILLSTPTFALVAYFSCWCREQDE